MHILILESLSRNFPYNTEEQLRTQKQDPIKFTSLESFLQSDSRLSPFVMIFEIGSLADFDRAHLAHEWSEKVQPMAAAKYILIISSRSLMNSEKMQKFRGIEVLPLPISSKSLIFKLELQHRLLGQTKRSLKEIKGFAPILEEIEDKNSHKKRVLIFRGPGPNKGSWKQQEVTGKTRWRWIQSEAVKEGDLPLIWETESQQAPKYDEKGNYWITTGDRTALFCLQEGKEIFQTSIPAVNKSTAPTEVVDEVTISLPSTESKTEALGTQAYSEPKEGDSFSQKIREEKQSPSLKEVREQKQSSTAPYIGFEADATPSLDEVVTEKKSIHEELKQNFKDNTSLNTSSSSTGIFSESEASEKAKSVEHAMQASDVKAHSKEKNTPQQHSTYKQKESTNQSGVDEVSHLNRGDVLERELPFIKTSLYTKTVNAEDEVPESRPFHNNEWTGDTSTASNVCSVKKTSPEKVEQERLALLEQQSDLIEKAVPTKNKNPTLEDTEGTPSQNETVNETVAKNTPEEKKGGTEELDIAPEEKQRAELIEEVTAPETPQITSSETAGENHPLLQSNMDKEEPLKRTEETSFERAPLVRKEIVKVRGLKKEREDILIPAEGRKPITDKERAALYSRYFVKRTLLELTDKNSSWYPIDKYRIYLSAQVRYYGLKSQTEIIPLWIYEGELAPEFLEEQQAWKFYDRAPLCYDSIESLPLPILEYFYKLNPAIFPHWENAKNNSSIPSEQESKQTQKKQSQTPRLQDARSGSLWEKLKQLFNTLFR